MLLPGCQYCVNTTKLMKRLYFNENKSILEGRAYIKPKLNSILIDLKKKRIYSKIHFFAFV